MLPQRLLGTIRGNLAVGRVPNGLCLAVAGWMRYVGGTDAAEEPIDGRDPLAESLKALAATGDPVAARLGVTRVFGEDPPGDPRFRDTVAVAQARLGRNGARASVAA